MICEKCTGNATRFTKDSQKHRVFLPNRLWFGQPVTILISCRNNGCDAMFISSLPGSPAAIIFSHLQLCCHSYAAGGAYGSGVCSMHSTLPRQQTNRLRGRSCRQRCASVIVKAKQTLPLDATLDDVRVVLVAPKTAANVGAVARCAANFEAVQLWVVAPRCEPNSDEAYKVACGGASAILDNMVIVDDLAAALADTSGSIGFTRRGGATRITHASISDMLNNFPDAIPCMTLVAGHNSALPVSWQQADGNGVVTAIVFGREESGLTEAELRLCSHACAIPTGRIQGSMNLSHAASVVLYELYQRRLAFQEFKALDSTTAAMALAGQLHVSHPAVPALSSLSWLLPLAHTDNGSSTQDSNAVSSQGSNSHGMVTRGTQAGVTGSQVITADQQASARGDEALQPATTAEMESLLMKVADIARAVGLSGSESRGGGNAGNHGRKKLPVGNIRALIGRAKPLQFEIRSLHGLASMVLAALDPQNPLASSRYNRLQPKSTSSDGQGTVTSRDK